MFRSAAGSTLYLGRCIRPDTKHPLTALKRSTSKPGPRPVVKLQRVLRYVRQTAKIGLFHSDDAGEDESTACVDADHAMPITQCRQGKWILTH